MRKKNCLTADDVSRIVTAAKTEAQKNHWAVTIAVVDDGGFLLHLERLDGAPQQSATIATGKAWTARPSSPFPAVFPFKAACRSCTKANASEPSASRA